MFDILIQLFSEIIKLSKARADELSENKQVSGTDRIENLMAQKEELENKLYNIEYRDGISDLVEELNSIKNQELNNGIKMGKTREYFKRGLWNMNANNISKTKSKNTKKIMTSTNPLNKTYVI